MNKKKVAFISGGAKRLGKHIALAFAGNGFDIVLNYNTSKQEAADVKKEIEKLGSECIAVQGDVSNERDVKNIFVVAMKKFRRVDVVVNNAAIIRKANLLETTTKIWDEVFDTNLKSVFLVSKEAAKIFKKQKSGRIINIASVGGLQGWKNRLAYSVSKAGVIHLTKILAKELAPEVCVNAIAPGIITFEGEEIEQASYASLDRIPLQEYGRPEDIASLVLYLANTSTYITGQIIPVDGGASIF